MKTFYQMHASLDWFEWNNESCQTLWIVDFKALNVNVLLCKPAVMKSMTSKKFIIVLSYLHWSNQKIEFSKQNDIRILLVTDYRFSRKLNTL